LSEHGVADFDRSLPADFFTRRDVARLPKNWMSPGWQVGALVQVRFVAKVGVGGQFLWRIDLDALRRKGFSPGEG